MATTKRRPSVPFFDYPHVFVSHERELLDVVRDVGRRGAFILQQDLEEFERRLAAYVQADYALGVANGTDALFIALRAASPDKTRVCNWACSPTAVTTKRFRCIVMWCPCPMMGVGTTLPRVMTGPRTPRVWICTSPARSTATPACST